METLKSEVRAVCGLGVIVWYEAETRFWVSVRNIEKKDFRAGFRNSVCSMSGTAGGDSGLERSRGVPLNRFNPIGGGAAESKEEARVDAEREERLKASVGPSSPNFGSFQDNPS